MRSILLNLGLLLVASLVSVTAQAQPAATPLLAILEFDSPDNAAGPDELAVLTNEFRGAVIATVGARYRVLTRENMEVLLPPDRIQCAAGKCAAEIGRMLQASHVMAGSVRKMDGEWVVSLEAYESVGGVALGAEQFFGARLRELVSAVRKESPVLVRRWLALDGAATSRLIDPPKAAPLVVKVESIPQPTREEPRLPPPPPGPQWAVRAGMGGHLGLVGVGVEWRPSWWGVALGTGYMPLSGGLTFGAPNNAGGFYFDLYAVLHHPGLWRAPTNTGWGVGAITGWDWRFGDGWSLKTGAGYVYTSDRVVPYGTNWFSSFYSDRPPLMFDLAFGKVFP